MIKKCGYGSCAVGVDNFARKRNGRHANWASNWAPRYIPGMIAIEWHPV
jgi:hypothetical protein